MGEKMEKAKAFKREMDKKDYPMTMEGLKEMDKDNKIYKQLMNEAIEEKLKEEGRI